MGVESGGGMFDRQPDGTVVEPAGRVVEPVGRVVEPVGIFAELVGMVDELVGVFPEPVDKFPAPVDWFPEEPVGTFDEPVCLVVVGFHCDGYRSSLLQAASHLNTKKGFSSGTASFIHPFCRHS